MRFVLVALVAIQLLGCASWRSEQDEPVAVAAIAQTPWAMASLPQVDGKPWQRLPLPGKRETQFDPVRADGRAALAVTADASASMVRRQVHVPADALGQLSFSWKVPALIAGADMAARDADDAPVRLVLAFEGDRSRFSAKNAMLSELARALTGEEMPYATLMYVWCNSRAPGSVIMNPRTDRIRKIVVESGSDGLGQWRDYERDVRADFVRAFGEEPGALVAVGIMTDSDNTGSHVRAWYGPLNLHRSMAAAP
ncbi:DUF3047 domain-containing protein [Pseudorhodoferax sp. LjRoot39]|uniref:DUF3047 domain-containing protein n=1 Tax=Pseudorhodoferax sp. LjRoot39 TaxID=3342328 RepID=UPI003ECD0784